VDILRNETGVLKALAHITGGGLTENLPRVLPQGRGAEIDLDTWNILPVFKWLAEQGGLDEAEMLKTFNCGIGMIAVVPEDRVDVARVSFAGAGHDVVEIGRVVEGEGVAYRGALL